MSVNADFEDSMQSGPVGTHTLRLQCRYPVIAASHLRLRPFTLADLSPLIRVVATNRVVDGTLAVPRPFDSRQARQWIESHPLAWRTRCAVHWAVSGLDDDCLAGYVGLHDIRMEQGRAKVSFWIAERISRKERAIEATQAALAFAFTSLQVNTVRAHQLSGNPLVARVLRQLRMKPDAAGPQLLSRGDGREEEVIPWSVTRTAWLASLHDRPTH